MSKRKSLSSDTKYLLYETSVQDPAQQIALFRKVFRQAYGKQPTSLCEDFCGTFLNSARWIESANNHTASAIDLNPEPLKYGKKVHIRSLKDNQRSRIKIIQGNVLTPLKKKHDVISACNFSFYVFKDRKVLLNYCKRSFKGLNKQGAFVLEMVGGAGFIEAPYEEKRTVRYKEYLLDKDLPKKRSKAVYYWNHESYDPINRLGAYSITFKIPGKELYKRCFKYNWRIWTIPEVKECMLEAGFKKVDVYWDIAKSNNNSIFEKREKADNDDYTWLCYVVGIK